jgi:hypothetical protein
MTAHLDRPAVKARIAIYRGAPALLVGGRPAAALAYGAFDLREPCLHAAAAAGVELFTFEATADYHYDRLAADAWPEPRRFDYRQFDERIGMILAACPHARVLPRICLCSPPWWDDTHPDQLMAGQGGVYDPAPDAAQHPAAETRPAPKKMTAPSFSSQAWLGDSGAALQRLLRYAEDRYGGAIIGYLLAGGASGEWLYWGLAENLFPDTSPAQERAFLAWLRRRGWIGVRDVTVPTGADRQRSEFGEFRDPSTLGPALAVEYLRFHGEAVAAAIAHFAHLARETVGPDKLLGASYGRFADLSRRPAAWQTSGHLAMRSFLADADIDFVAGPVAGAGGGLPDALAASLAHRGKLWLAVSDAWAPAARDPKKSPAPGPATALDVRRALRRDFAVALCHGAGAWWLDRRGGAGAAAGECIDDGAAMADVARMVEIGRRSVRADRSPAAEIAVVLDDESVHCLRCGSPVLAPLVGDQLEELARVGAPLSVIHADDVAAVGRHKFYIFLNLFYVTDERLRRTCEATRSAGVTALWFYAPGLAEDCFSVGRMERLTGLRLAVEKEPAALAVRTAEKGPGPSFTYGTAERLAPVVWADDPRAEVLGEMAGGRPGLVRRRLEGGAVTIFSAAPAMPAALVRRLAAEAGVHVWAAGGEAVCANRSFLAVAGEAGSRPALRLPEGETLYDLFEEKEIALAGGAGPLPASADGTWLFFRGGREAWEQPAAE